MLETPAQKKSGFAETTDVDLGAMSPELEALKVPEGAIAARRWGTKVVAVVVGETPELQVHEGGSIERHPLLPIDAPKVAYEGGESHHWLPAEWPAASAFSPESVRLRCGPEGVGLALASGHFVCLREDGLGSWMQGPAAERCYAEPTRWGTLLTLRAPGPDAPSMLLHVDASGTLLARWPHQGLAQAMAGAVLLDEERCAANNRRGEELVVLGLPGLTQLARKKIGMAVIQDLHGAGEAFAAVAEEDVFEARVEGEKSRLRSHALTAAHAKAKKRRANAADRAAKAWKPEPADGPPQIGFDALKHPAPAWKWEAGESWKVQLHVRSAGEPSEGLDIVATGAALQKGLVRLKTISVQGAGGAFDEGTGAAGPQQKVALPSVKIPRGVVYPWKKKPRKESDKEMGLAALEATHIVLELEGEALASGAGMLRLEISTAGTKPMKWIRPVTVL